jgi:hypothetical protein
VLICQEKDTVSVPRKGADEFGLPPSTGRSSKPKSYSWKSPAEENSIFSPPFQDWDTIKAEGELDSESDDHVPFFGPVTSKRKRRERHQREKDQVRRGIEKEEEEERKKTDQENKDKE